MHQFTIMREKEPKKKKLKHLKITEHFVYIFFSVKHKNFPLDFVHSVKDILVLNVD